MTGLKPSVNAQSGNDRAAANLCCNGERDVLDDFAAREAAEADDGREAAQVVAEQRHVRRLHRYRGPCAGFDFRFKFSISSAELIAPFQSVPSLGMAIKLH